MATYLITYLKAQEAPAPALWCHCFFLCFSHARLSYCMVAEKSPQSCTHAAFTLAFRHTVLARRADTQCKRGLNVSIRQYLEHESTFNERNHCNQC